VRTALDNSLDPGTSLDSTVTVTDDAGHLVEASVSGFVRGKKLTLPPLTLTMITARRAFPGSQVRYTMNVKNTGLPLAEKVVLTTTLPQGTTFVLATPPPSTSAGGVLTWKLGDLLRASQTVVRLSVRVNSNVAAGTVLSSSAEAKDDAGNTSDASASVNIVAK